MKNAIGKIKRDWIAVQNSSNSSPKLGEKSSNQDIEQSSQLRKFKKSQ